MKEFRSVYLVLFTLFFAPSTVYADPFYKRLGSECLNVNSSDLSITNTLLTIESRIWDQAQLVDYYRKFFLSWPLFTDDSSLEKTGRCAGRISTAIHFSMVSNATRAFFMGIWLFSDSKHHGLEAMGFWLDVLGPERKADILLAARVLGIKLIEDVLVADLPAAGQGDPFQESTHELFPQVVAPRNFLSVLEQTETETEAECLDEIAKGIWSPPLLDMGEDFEPLNMRADLIREDNAIHLPRPAPKLQAPPKEIVLLSEAEEKQIARNKILDKYREKRKKRRYGKVVTYPNRAKACVTRKRAKGRFLPRDESEKANEDVLEGATEASTAQDSELKF